MVRRVLITREIIRQTSGDPLEALLECVAVREPRQRIVEGLVGEPLFEVLAFRYVLKV